MFLAAARIRDSATRMKNPDALSRSGFGVRVVRQASFANFSVPSTLVNFQFAQSPSAIGVS